MKVLNLANANNWNIGYKLNKFPDGQQNTVIDPSDVLPGNEVLIKTRLRNFLDLEVLLCATASLRELHVDNIFLYITYFCGARSDRKFQEGGNNYLKSVICPIINSQGYRAVTVLDPHSDVLEACLTNFSRQDATPIVNSIVQGLSEPPVLVAPDAGAAKRVGNLATRLGIKEVVTASKSRDVVTGAITGTHIEGVEPTKDDKTYLIVDDICDGGRTFIELAKAIRSKREGGQGKTTIRLFVTHGIFSAGLEPLRAHIDHIHTTNSYSEHEGVDSEWVVI